MHIVCLHHIRFPKNASFPLWNVACDYVVNSIIKDTGKMDLLNGALYDPKYIDWTAEQIYRELAKKQKQEEKGDEKQQSSDSEDEEDNCDKQKDNAANEGKGKGKDESGDDSEENQTEQKKNSSNQSKYQESKEISDELVDELKDLLERSKQSGEIRQFPDESKLREEEQSVMTEMILTKRMVEKSSQISKNNKNSIPKTIENIINAATSNALPWHRILADFITKTAFNDWDWQHPDPTYANSDILMPSIISDSANEFAIAIDVSGSINVNQLERFISETKSILRDIEYSKVHVIYCSNGIHRYDVFTKEDEIVLYEVGSGGTAFDPVWKFIEEEGLDLSGLVYFTDLDCPSQRIGDEPSYPVLWCVFSADWMDYYGGLQEVRKRGFLPTFGEIITMEEEP